MTDPGRVIDWYFNNIGDDSAFAVAATGPTCSCSLETGANSFVRPAFEVDGAPLAPTVTEPGSLILFGTVVAGAGFTIRRKRAIH